ncbi:HD-GYP domain-containing protein [Thermoanaerobacterium thermosaccharolyticum]|uniref:HD-GYP domain-containing protein n=1 Tax=Thermoanaerobacterium thermosaccharolyticum TaxID=1517 RepID=UPI0020A2F8E6|nr:diguanylate cyclase [Thermoanaerobacterium thermosaccharolyticum]MCP2241139.1 diguanylate cyclase (GGDEF)-like protein [Thermoanaerobacterium thermosaccharolyticum]
MCIHEIIRDIYDPLTGLYDRKYIEEKIKKLDESHKTSMAVIMLDINGIKLINDAFGYLEGDRLLKGVAKELRRGLRNNDIIARWGEDEFLVLMPDTDIENAAKKFETIVSSRIKLIDKNEQLSIAVGIASKDQSKNSIIHAIKDAEEEMNRQKFTMHKSHRSAVVNAILATLRFKSWETEEHAERLKDYCLIIGEKMNLTMKELNELALLAMLHDIGKIGISESILKKREPLTDIEWIEIKKHPEIGYEIISNISELKTIAEYILHHHERWDGNGYPHRLKKEEIPLLCRILSVADAFDAMTNDRIYRKALNIDQAILEIKKNAGTQFDPYIADLFSTIYKWKY